MSFPSETAWSRTFLFASALTSWMAVAALGRPAGALTGRLTLTGSTPGALGLLDALERLVQLGLLDAELLGQRRGVDAPQPHHAAARAAALPIHGVALLVARLSRRHGDAGALGGFRRVRIRVGQLRQAQTDPCGGEDGGAPEDKFLHRRFPFPGRLLRPHRTRVGGPAVKRLW